MKTHLQKLDQKEKYNVELNNLKKKNSCQMNL